MFGTSRERAYLRQGAYSGQGAYFFFEKRPIVQNKTLIWYEPPLKHTLMAL